MYKSYQTAMLALSSHKTQIKSIEEARQLKGIDEIILEKINVFLTQKFTTTEHVYFICILILFNFGLLLYR